MAEAIGVASSVLTLVVYAFKATTALSATVQDVHFHPKRVRDLLDELGSLSGVLSSLQDTVNATSEEEFSALKLPLTRCATTCEAFREEILKRSSRSMGGQASFRDWAKLKYMGEDIDGFRQVLASYGMTINVALAGVSVRRSTVTNQSLENYRQLITATKDDLEARLDSIDERLEVLVSRAVEESSQDKEEIEQIREERLSTQKCLDICAALSEQIGQLQREQSASAFADPTAPPASFINESLQECKNSLSAAAAKLEKHSQDLIDRLVAKSQSARVSEDDVADLARLRDEWKTTLHCRDLCSKADENLRENISVIRNYATGDAIQFMVSTNNKNLRGTNEGLGWRTRQVGGHLSDVSLQQLSRDMTGIGLSRPKDEAPVPQGIPPPAADSSIPKQTSEFKERYGPGLKLSSDPKPP